MSAGVRCIRNRDIVTIGKLSSASILLQPDSSTFLNEMFVEETYGEEGRPVV